MVEPGPSSEARSPSGVGAAAERQAEHYLAARGLTIQARNYRCRLGEIDLIALDGAVLVFVEVRARRARGWGSGAASISAGKRQRLVRAAQSYLATHPESARRRCRFDVLSIDLDGGPIEWIRGAFDAGSPW
jgi:putative endonuclease